MYEDSMQPAMRQKIFSMNLDVETVSLYLLCCALADAGAAITIRALEDRWSGTRAELDRELQRLEERNIIRKDEAAPPEVPGYRIVDDRKWHWNEDKSQ
jgi:hypothetical protein